MTQMLELSDKDSQVAITVMLQQLIVDILKTNGNMDCLSKEIENIKQKQMENLELKNIIPKIKNSLQRLNSKVQMTDESVSECGARPRETVQSEQKGEKILKNNLTDPQGSEGQN